MFSSSASSAFLFDAVDSRTEGSCFSFLFHCKQVKGVWTTYYIHLCLKKALETMGRKSLSLEKILVGYNMEMYSRNKIHIPIKQAKNHLQTSHTIPYLLL